MDADFQNAAAALLREVDRTLAERRRAGLDGLVGGLAAVVLNVAPQDLVPAAEELLLTTGLRFEAALDASPTGDGGPCLLLRDGRGADFLVKSRAGGENPFAPYNQGQKIGPGVQARLETFLFECHDLDRYVAVQKARGVAFQTPVPVGTDAFACILTAPLAQYRQCRGIHRMERPAGRIRPRAKPAS